MALSGSRRAGLMLGIGAARHPLRHPKCWQILDEGLRARGAHLTCTSATWICLHRSRTRSARARSARSGSSSARLLGADEPSEYRRYPDPDRGEESIVALHSPPTHTWIRQPRARTFFDPRFYVL